MVAGRRSLHVPFIVDLISMVGIAGGLMGLFLAYAAADQSDFELAGVLGIVYALATILGILLFRAIYVVIVNHGHFIDQSIVALTKEVKALRTQLADQVPQAPEPTLDVVDATCTSCGHVNRLAASTAFVCSQCGHVGDPEASSADSG